MRILLVLIILAGCVEGHSNQEIIIATHECEEAGLRAVMLCDGAANCYVQCRPREEE